MATHQMTETTRSRGESIWLKPRKNQSPSRNTDTTAAIVKTTMFLFFMSLFPLLLYYPMVGVMPEVSG